MKAVQNIYLNGIFTLNKEFDGDLKVTISYFN